MTAPKIDHRKAAKLILEGHSQKEALLAAGYSRDTAARSSTYLARRSRGLREALAEAVQEMAKAKETLPLPGVRADYVRTQLFWNMVAGAKPGSNEAARLLGQDREVNMWEPDTRLGVQVDIRAVPEGLKADLLTPVASDDLPSGGGGSSAERALAEVKIGSGRTKPGTGR
jgi:hypothetical protein